MSDTPEFTKLNSILKKFNERALNFLASKMLGETDMNLRNAIKFNYTDIYTASLEHNLPIARELKQIRNLYASIAPLNSTNDDEHDIRKAKSLKQLIAKMVNKYFVDHGWSEVEVCYRYKGKDQINYKLKPPKLDSGERPP